MKIAIIGAGNVGGTPGAAWANSGHQVVFGAASVKDAAAAAEVAALTWPAAQDALRSAGDLAEKSCSTAPIR
jgi:predicted dinucleotide-binding enzyme